MSIRHQNWQRSSSRRKVVTATISSAVAVTVSSPWPTQYPAIEPGRAPAMTSPSFSSVSSIAESPSALDRADAADLVLQQQNAIEQRLCGGRAAGNVDVDRHDAIAAAHDRIGIMIVAAAVGA